MYGLPMQTPASFDRTLAFVTALNPDRVALHAYVHRPERFKPQRRIARLALPCAGVMAGMFSSAVEAFGHAGYLYLGIDLFALRSDALAVAKRQGRLHRNLLGFSTQPEGDLMGLGVSAIGRMGAAYSQNARTLEVYYDQLGRGQYPVVRGLALSRDDLIRRAVIMSLMCHGEVQFESIELAWLVDFRRYFAAEFNGLLTLADEGRVTVNESGIRLTALGQLFPCAVAMVFYRYLQFDVNRARVSNLM